LFDDTIAENARLKAEVEAVRQEYSDATNHYNRLHNDLQAQVERLTKAGDAMADMVDWEVPYERRKKLEADWNAAKEGKQSNG
jgi:predicted  nucleic acid-binding Zn-ribbon protein